MHGKGPLQKADGTVAVRTPTKLTIKRLDEFLNELKECGGSAGNQKLRQRLGWEEEFHWRVQGRLIEEGRIVAGRGIGWISRVHPSSGRRLGCAGGRHAIGYSRGFGQFAKESQQNQWLGSNVPARFKPLILQAFCWNWPKSSSLSDHARPDSCGPGGSGSEAGSGSCGDLQHPSGASHAQRADCRSLRGC